MLNQPPSITDYQIQRLEQQELDEATRGTISMKLVREGATVTLKADVGKLNPQPARRARYLHYYTDGSHNIGVSVNPVDATLTSHLKLTHGLLITDVTKDRPADKAGLKPHDVLITVNDEPMTNVEALQKMVGQSKDEPLQMRILRNGTEQTAQVTPVRRNANFLRRIVPSVRRTGRSGYL